MSCGVELVYKFLLIKERLTLLKLAFSDTQILYQCQVLHIVTSTTTTAEAAPKTIFIANLFQWGGVRNELLPSHPSVHFLTL